MSSRKRIQRKNPWQPTPASDILQSRPFSNGKKARESKLPTTNDILQTRPFSPRNNDVSSPKDTRSFEEKMIGAEFGYNGVSMPAFAPSEPPSVQREEDVEENSQEQAEGGTSAANISVFAPSTPLENLILSPFSLRQIGGWGQEETRKREEVSVGEEEKEGSEVGIQKQQLESPPDDGIVQRLCDECESELAEDEDKEPIQAKLTVGEPGDKYEQEADGVAAQVVSKINSPPPQESVQPQLESGVTSVPNIAVMRHSEGGTGEGTSVTADVEEGIQRARGGGQGLDESVREPMEGAFGADFSGVKVHTDAQSDQLNQSIQAKAFTTGQDIFFKQGEYQPGSKGGQELLAHELTHVVQQTGGIQRKSQIVSNLTQINRDTKIQRAPNGMPPKKGTTKIDKKDAKITASGKTITEAITNLTAKGKGEAGSVTCAPESDFKTYQADDKSAPIVYEADILITETKAMPVWTELDQQCEPVKKEWARFYSALDTHENGHISIDEKAFKDLHKKIIGKKQAEGDKIFNDTITKADTDNQTYDTKNQHGLTQGTGVNPVQCEPEKVYQNQNRDELNPEIKVQTKQQVEIRNNKERSPNVQMKCADCEGKETIQLKAIAENIAPRDNKVVQKFGWDDVKNTVGAGAQWVGDKASAGAQWVGDKAGEVASMGKDAFASLVAKVAPGLADLIRNGPMGLLTEKIKEGVKSWVSGVMSGVNIGSVITGLKSSFAGVFETVKGLGKGDPASCKAFAQSIKSLQELGQAFMDNPVIKQIQTAFTTVSGTFKKVTDLVIAPVFDTVMSVAGGVFNGVKGFATTIWNWGAPVRNTLGAAWDWVKQQLGFSGDGEGGVLGWLKTKASEAWGQIKATFAPVIEPLKKVGTVLLAFSPVGMIAAVVKFVPQLVQSGQWLWAHKDDPNIVKSAHAQMGHTILPQILSGVQGFSSAVQSTVSSLVNQVVKLNEAVLGLLGGITGVPLLSAAQSVVQALSNGVKELVNWGQESFLAAAKGVQEAFVKIKTKIEPYAGVLSSIGLAIANPAMIPVILAGSAWQMLDNCYKLPIIDFLLDIVIGLLEAAPSLPMFGLLWPMLKAGVVGFLKGVKGQPADTKVAITNKLAKIISGGSPAFILGFVKGLLKGIWEGLSDPFVLMYEGIKGLGNLITWLNDTANQALSPQPATQPGATAQKAEASEEPTADKAVIGQTLQQMGQELQPPAAQVTEGFMPAVKAAFSGGEGLTFEGLRQKLGEAWAAVESAITNAGGELAQKVCAFMMEGTAEGQMGETVGWLAGTIAFEVALGILTAGSATAAKGAMKVLQTFAKILDWTGEALGLAFKGLAKLGGFVLDMVKGIGKLLSNAGGAAKTVLGALGEIGEKLIKYASELLGKVGKSAAGEVVEEGVEKTTKETLEAGASKGAKETVEAGAEKSTKEAVEAGASKGAKEGAEEGASKGAKETTDDAAKKAAELPAAIAQARAITEANDAVDTPVPALIGILNSTVKPKYSWLERFEYRPKGMPGHYSVHMIASDHEIDPDYTTTNKGKKREPITDPRIIRELPSGEVRTPEELEKARQYFKNRKLEARRRWEERTGDKWPTDQATGLPARASHPRPLADGGDPMVVEPAFGDPNTEHMIPDPVTGKTDQQRFGSREGTKPRGGKREPITDPRIIRELPSGEVRTPEELEKARQYFKNRKLEARRRWEERTGDKWPTDQATGLPARASHPRPLADGGDPMVVEPAFGDPNTEHMIPDPVTGKTDQQRFGNRRKNKDE